MREAATSDKQARIKKDFVEGTPPRSIRTESDECVEGTPPLSQKRHADIDTVKDAHPPLEKRVR